MVWLLQSECFSLSHRLIAIIIIFSLAVGAFFNSLQLILSVNLVAINLGFNKIEGNLPVNVADYPTLSSLSLCYNRLRGAIPLGYAISSIANCVLFLPWQAQLRICRPRRQLFPISGNLRIAGKNFRRRFSNQ
ncbi:hypothetical protein GOBAR_AA14092 [Gossypium barbadense]|uniref:Uncharacterized protein n=1 Tax=Gossypium barbadense TaxID=3634 RepID=A0A2P5XT56_GOSBA|nr:hypothetical protein GOBAR_AA14092 [Gossypium barbadense]